MFERVAAGLGDACRQWVAWHSGTPVAAAVVLVHGQHALFWRGYSIKSVAGPLRANSLLQKLAIEDACEHGCRFYGMGQSGDVASLERFKESFGASSHSAPKYSISSPTISMLAALKRRALRTPEYLPIEQ